MSLFPPKDDVIDRISNISPGKPSVLNPRTHEFDGLSLPRIMLCKVMLYGRKDIKTGRLSEWV